MFKIFTSLIRDDRGASAAEYALILAIVGTGIAGAAFALGGAITNSIEDATACIQNAASTNC